LGPPFPSYQRQKEQGKEELKRKRKEKKNATGSIFV
jgi:hypothetical protein